MTAAILSTVVVGWFGWLAALGAADVGETADLEAFSYTNTEAARKHWQPQFGSKPARVEKLPSGGTCLALDADFANKGDRACWDWSARLDLSQVGRITFDAQATNTAVVGTVGLYFGTPNGWYAKFSGLLPETWKRQVYPLEVFGVEGKPEGWDKVTTFRFSVWSSGPGKVTFRLRSFQMHGLDPAENLLRNGSFEIVSAGMPYAWGSGHWGIGDLPWATNMDLWRRHWHLDRTVAHHGTTSLCIENVPDLPLLKAHSVWVHSKKPCVLSAWLRSDQERLPIALSCGRKSATVEVGRDWKQAVLKAVEPGEHLLAAIVPKAAGRLWIDAVQLQTCAEATPEYHSNFEDEGLAERERLVDWSPPRRTPQVARGRSIAGPVKSATVGVDAEGRFLLDGRPYLQHSLGLEYVSDLRILDFVAQSGFKDVCVEVSPGVATQRLKDIADRCAQAGLRLIPWLDGTIPRGQFAEHIKALRDHGALLCWYVYDEPSGEGFAEAEARVKLAKELDPSRPAFINYLSNKLEGHVGDLYSTDVYPIPHGTPLHAVNAVAKMKASAEKERKPVWMWLQGTGYAYWMDREPTPRELSCMVYGTLLAGARGIYYFAQVPRTRECFAEMRALCVELEALAPVLGSLEAAPRVWCDHVGIHCKAYAQGGRVWVLAVNTQASACSARFSGLQSARTLNVAFEGRRLAFKGGRWEDAFGPYERHVYVTTP